MKFYFHFLFCVCFSQAASLSVVVEDAARVGI